jgi:Lrp/AsnC family leucine-responsive transcriptional regulator
MIDDFDCRLLDEAQRDADRTAEELAERVALSPSAIARRLRRLRSEGWLARTIAIISPKLIERRLRALVLIQLNEHADHAGKQSLLKRLNDTEEVQFAYEISGAHDLVALINCESMEAFVDLAEALFAADATVRRYETSFVKRELKFAPFVRLTELPMAQSRER